MVFLLGKRLNYALTLCGGFAAGVMITHEVKRLSTRITGRIAWSRASEKVTRNWPSVLKKGLYLICLIATGFSPPRVALRSARHRMTPCTASDFGTKAVKENPLLVKRWKLIRAKRSWVAKRLKKCIGWRQGLRTWPLAV